MVPGALALAALGAAVVVAGSRPDATIPTATAAKMRGLCWEGGREIEPRHLDPAVEVGADWISQTPFGWCRGLADTEIVLATGRVLWGESDSGLVKTAQWAHARGIKTLLKPHLWVHHGQWVGDIDMQSAADWRTWFASYERWILHYAELAEANGMEALAVGTELKAATRHTKEWRQIIRKVRAVYHGPLTYCANWSDEAERIEFWDALDFAGVQAYYPLATSEHPAPDEVRVGWKTAANRIEMLARRTGKPVVLTEVGYKSMTGSLREPWAWDDSGPQDLDVQREAYAAMFETIWEKPWCGGVFIWKWHPRLLEGWGRAACDFTPQGKPALDVLRTWYRAAAQGAPPARAAGRP